MKTRNFYFFIPILALKAYNAQIKISQFTAQLTSEWTTSEIIPGVGSLMNCNMKCERIHPNCNVFWFYQSNLECQVGLINTLDVIGSGVFSFCKVSWFLVSITLQVRNLFNNELISGVTVTAKSTQDKSDYFEGITNQNGEAYFQFYRQTEIVIELGGNGYAHMVSNKVIDDVFEETIALEFSNLRENELKMMISWGCCVSDMDTVAYIYGDTPCSLTIHGSCARGQDGLIKQTNDVTSHSTGQSEILDWTGFFPNNDIHLMGLNGRGLTLGPNWFWNTGLNVTLIGAFQSLNIVPKVQTSTTQNLWIAGCFKPSAGLSSFTEINQYVDQATRELCPI